MRLSLNLITGVLLLVVSKSHGTKFSPMWSGLALAYNIFVPISIGSMKETRYVPVDQNESTVNKPVRLTPPENSSHGFEVHTESQWKCLKAVGTMYDCGSLKKIEVSVNNTVKNMIKVKGRGLTEGGYRQITRKVTELNEVTDLCKSGSLNIASNLGFVWCKTSNETPKRIIGLITEYPELGTLNRFITNSKDEKIVNYATKVLHWAEQIARAMLFCQNETDLGKAGKMKCIHPQNIHHFTKDTVKLSLDYLLDSDDELAKRDQIQYYYPTKDLRYNYAMCFYAICLQRSPPFLEKEKRIDQNSGNDTCSSLRDLLQKIFENKYFIDFVDILLMIDKINSTFKFVKKSELKFDSSGILVKYSGDVYEYQPLNIETNVPHTIEFGISRKYLLRELQIYRTMNVNIQEPNTENIQKLHAVVEEEINIRNIKIGISIVGLLLDKMDCKLDSYLKNGETNKDDLSDDSILKWTLQIATALDYCHRRGIVHRSVDPTAIGIINGNAMLCNFRTAREKGPTMTSGTTGEYRAPETIASNKTVGFNAYGTPADVYSFGALILTMLIKRTDIKAVIDMNDGAKIKEEIVKERGDGHLAKKFSKLILTAVSKDPNTRYSMQDMIKELENIKKEWKKIKKTTSKHIVLTMK